MLNDNFYTLFETSFDLKGNYLCKVRFNPSHVIYQVHFQGNPITPGACIVQIVKDLSQRLTHQSLFINEIKSLKFTNAITPQEYPEVIFQITLNPHEYGKGYASKALIYAGDVVFAKMSFSLTPHSS